MHRLGTITNDSRGWPPEGGGETASPDPIRVPWNACANDLKLTIINNQI